MNFNSPKTLNRRGFVGLATLAALSGTTFVASCAQPAPATAPVATAKPAQKPNVLFIVVDDLRNSLGAYGNSTVQSPHIDELLGRGMRFDRAYCQYPVCNPSRVSFLAGQRPQTTGVLHNRPKFAQALPDVVSLPGLFRRNGYYSAGIGKIFHGAKHDPEAFDLEVMPREEEAAQTGEGRLLGNGSLKWAEWRATNARDEDHVDGKIAARGIRILEERKKSGEPFFLALGFLKPHDPFVAPKKYFEMYPKEQLRPFTDPPGTTPALPITLSSGMKAAFDAFSDRDRLEFLRAYYACVSFTDAQVGKVMEAMDRLKLWDSTVVVFVSDHGYHLGERGWWNKNTAWEFSARAPLGVWAPGMKAKGQNSDALVEFIDIYPTLTDLCDLPAPPQTLEGLSLRPLLSDAKARVKDAAFTVVDPTGKGTGVLGRSIRTDEWRYTEWGDGREGAELYHHPEDAGEFFNLADDPRFAKVRGELQARLNATLPASALQKETPAVKK